MNYSANNFYVSCYICVQCFFSDDIDKYTDIMASKF